MKNLGLTFLFLAFVRALTSSAFAYTAYVTDSGIPAVYEINTTTNEVVATVSSGDFSFSIPYVIAITPDGEHAYVADNGNFFVYVFDTKSNIVTAAIPLPDSTNATSITVSPDGKTVYVGVGSQIEVIETSSNTVIGFISLLDAALPLNITFTPNGKYAYVADPATNARIYVIDTTNLTVIAIVEPQDPELYPFALVMTSNGLQAYASYTSPGGGAFLIIDTNPSNETWNTAIGEVTVSGSFTTPQLPIALAISPNGKFVYGLDSENNLVYVITTSTNEVVHQIPVTVTAPFSLIAITPDGGNLYVTPDADNVYQVNTSSYAVSPVTNTFVPFNTVYGIAMVPESLSLGLYNIARLRTIYNATVEEATTLLNQAGL